MTLKYLQLARPAMVLIGLLLAACRPIRDAPTPRPIPPIPTVAPPTATPATYPLAPSTGCTETATAEVIWPQLIELQPAQARPGDEVIVIGSGGYTRCGQAYNESARSFPLYFDGQPLSQLSCYANRCEVRLAVPPDTASGEHIIAVEGGAELRLQVERQ